MTDILTAWNTAAGYGDWVPDPSSVSVWVDETGASVRDESGGATGIEIDPGTGLAEGGDLVTAVLISLFTDAAASADDALPDRSGDLRGWWGSPVGSKLWLRYRSRPNDALLGLVQNDIEAALSWLIDDKVATSIDVITSYPTPAMLLAQITVNRRAGGAVKLRFSRVWEF